MLGPGRLGRGALPLACWTQLKVRDMDVDMQRTAPTVAARLVPDTGLYF